MKLIIVRHGESKANLNRLPQGKKDKWTNTSLSKNGIEQAKRIAERLKDEKIDEIYSSDLKRAKQTAKKINKHHKVKIKLDKRIREKLDEEDMEDFIARVKNFFYDIKSKNKTILVLAHGGVNLTLLAISTGDRKKGGKIAKQIRNANTAVNIIEKEGEHYKIKLINCIKHLDHNKKLIEIFKKVQKLKEKYLGYKSNLLLEKLKQEGFKAKKIKAIFNWKDLPVPKKIFNLLNSNTLDIHDAVRVRVHGNYLYLDPTWKKSLEKKEFPITKDWSGLEDTKQITEGELEFFKEKDFEENKDKIIKDYKINNTKPKKFIQEFEKWLNEIQ